MARPLHIMKKEKAYWVAFFVMLMIGSISGQGICFPLKEADDRKKEIQLPATPGRSISLVPTLTELLFALALEKEIVRSKERLCPRDALRAYLPAGTRPLPRLHDDLPGSCIPPRNKLTGNRNKG